MTSTNRAIAKRATIGPFGIVVAKSVITAVCLCVGYGLISALASALLRQFGEYAGVARWLLILVSVLAVIWDVRRTDLNEFMGLNG